ncbi:MAG TPA: ABC transporter ATP-binding protein [Treponemataceae bacterium]|nr:ABC transporter ATP-binding protein [Treponemataceae bacterium]HQL04459.1 ABC transporter ATP-binding protein [Treponemataceae bacterium]
MVVIKDVEKVYLSNSENVHALQGVSAKISDGEFMAFAGPSGSGKTTLLNLVGCLDSLSKGSIFLDDEEISSLSSPQKSLIRQKKIGFIFQSYNLIPVLTARENVELALDILHTHTKKEMKDISYAILSEVGLAGLEERKPNQLSGGQQQRVSIARALVKNPSVILADEPTANLDSANSEMILQLMKELNKKHNSTFIFSTHDQMVLSYVDRIISLKDGLIVSDETKRSV